MPLKTGFRPTSPKTSNRGNGFDSKWQKQQRDNTKKQEAPKLQMNIKTPWGRNIHESK